MKEGNVRVLIRSLRYACAGALLLTSLVLVDALLFPHIGTRVAKARGAEAGRQLSSICYWNNIDWDKMTIVERQAWMQLGWTRNQWELNGDGVAKPESSSKDWGDLTATEKHAALQLGYLADSWDADYCQ